MYESVRRFYPVEVVSIEWRSGLNGEDLQKLQCTCCKTPLSNLPWALAWIIDKGVKRSARLCNECGIDAGKK